MRSIGNGSKDSVMRVLAPEIEVFGVVVQRRGHLYLVLCPFLKHRGKVEGENTHEGVLYLGIHGCLVVV